jgi:hypothetical protein
MDSIKLDDEEVLDKEKIEMKERGREKCKVYEYITGHKMGQLEKCTGTVHK